MEIISDDREIHILGKLSGEFTASPDGSKILYITNTKTVDEKHQHIDVLIYNIKTGNIITVKNVEYLMWQMYHGAHHWTYFHKIGDIWTADIQFNPFLYPGHKNDDNTVPFENRLTMLRINLESGQFERLPVPFPDKHLIHIPLNKRNERAEYKIDVIRSCVSAPGISYGSLTTKCGVYHNGSIVKEITHDNIINRCYMLENGAFSDSSRNNECKLTYM